MGQQALTDFGNLLELLKQTCRALERKETTHLGCRGFVYIAHKKKKKKKTWASVSPAEEREPATPTSLDLFCWSTFGVFSPEMVVVFLCSGNGKSESKLSPFFQGILLFRKPSKTKGNSWFLIRTMVDKNGESTPRSFRVRNRRAPFSRDPCEQRLSKWPQCRRAVLPRRKTPHFSDSVKR